MTDANLAGEARKLLFFRIGAQEFCVDTMDVREIRGWTPATPIPEAPAFVCGVINLRGAVLPIVDLGARLGLGAADPTERHVTIVAQLATQVMGLLVDAVSDILTVTDDMVQPTPEVGSDLARAAMRGLIAIEGRMVSFISLSGLFPPDELAQAA